jgi:hypothetical protein
MKLAVAAALGDTDRLLLGPPCSAASAAVRFDMGAVQRHLFGRLRRSCRRLEDFLPNSACARRPAGLQRPLGPSGARGACALHCGPWQPRCAPGPGPAPVQARARMAVQPWLAPAASVGQARSSRGWSARSSRHRNTDGVPRGAGGHRGEDLADRLRAGLGRVQQVIEDRLT